MGKTLCEQLQQTLDYLAAPWRSKLDSCGLLADDITSPNTPAMYIEVLDSKVDQVFTQGAQEQTRLECSVAVYCVLSIETATVRSELANWSADVMHRIAQGYYVECGGIFSSLADGIRAYPMQFKPDSGLAGQAIVFDIALDVGEQLSFPKTSGG